MSRIKYIINHPYAVESSDIPLLKIEVEKYPYFHTLHALLLYGLKKENHPSFEDYLNKASIFSSNRVDLYRYINSEEINNDVNSSLNSLEKVKINNNIESKEDNLDDNYSNLEVSNIKNDLQSKKTNNLTNFSNVDNRENLTISKEQFTEKVKEDIISFSNNSQDTLSFQDWLKKFSHRAKFAEKQEIKERNKKYKLIDDFLEKNPKIKPNKDLDNISNNVPPNYVYDTEEYSDLMTETLAQIYIEQNKFDKAIKAYKILILKYPEKNGFFADRIKEIENLKK